MPILPKDKEALWDACKEIARENYGLLYVDTEERRKGLIKKYEERASKRRLAASTVSSKGLMDFLAERIRGEEEKGERLIGLRESVYFIPVVFSEKEIGDKEIEKLEKLFEENIVLSAEMIRKEFSIAYDDRLFFVGELAKRGLINALSEGEEEKVAEYYAMGNTLRDSVSTNLFMMAIGGYAEAGLVTHAKLEEAIKVDATNEVIGYLEEEGILVRVNNRYLVHGMTAEFARKIADEIEGSIEEKFREYNYVVNEAVIRGGIEDKISERYNIPDHKIKEEVVTSVLNEVIQICGLNRDEVHSDILIEPAGLSQLIEEKAEEIHQKVLLEAKDRTLGKDKIEGAVNTFIAELYLSPEDRLNRFILDKVKQEVEEKWGKKRVEGGEE